MVEFFRRFAGGLLGCDGGVMGFFDRPVGVATGLVISCCRALVGEWFRPSLPAGLRYGV